MELNGGYQSRPDYDEPLKTEKPARYSPRVVAQIKGQPLDWSPERPVSAIPHRVYDPAADRRVLKVKRGTAAAKKETSTNQIRTTMATTTKPKPAAFIRFDSTTVSNKRQVKPRLSLSASGIMFLSAEASGNLGLDEHSRVAVFQDPETKTAWYLALDPERGFPVRAKEKAKGYIFNSSATCKAIKASLGLDEGKAAVLLVSDKPVLEDDGVQYFAILAPTKSE